MTSFSSVPLEASSSPSKSNDDDDSILLYETTTTAHQWKDQEGGRFIVESLQYLDVVTIIQKKSINKDWQRLCTQVISNKCNKKKKFETNKELLELVDKYSPGSNEQNTKCR